MFRSFFASVAAGLLILLSTSPASATTISLNFATLADSHGAGGSDAPDDLASPTSAGVIFVPNWNNLHLDSGTQGSLTDSSGATTTASATWASNGTYVTGSGDANGNSQMMNAEIDERASGFGGPVPATVSVSSLPANLSNFYNVFVYYSAVQTGAVVNSSYNIGSTTYFTQIPANTPAFSGTFTREANTSGSGPFTSGANFVEFTGLSGSSFTLTIDPLDFRGEINGIQISNVPEPGTCVLLSLGTAALFALRRCNRAAVAR